MYPAGELAVLRQLLLSAVWIAIFFLTYRNNPKYWDR